MSSPQKLTVDLTVVREYLSDRESRHDDAVRLFAAAKAGLAELAIAPQGARTDVPRDPLRSQIQMLLRSGLLVELPQLARLSDVTFPSDALFPGAYVKGFDEAWDATVAQWRSHERKPPGQADGWHVETHIHCQRDVLITDDRALLVMCGRLTNEHGITVRAERLTDHVRTLKAES